MQSNRILKAVAKGVLTLLSVGVAVYAGYVFLNVVILGGFDRDCSVAGLKQHFEEKRTEIYELKRFFKKIVPADKFVDIEFENDRKLARLRIDLLDTTIGKPNGMLYMEWNLRVGASRTDARLRVLGWTEETLEQLKEKLDNAGCIGIQSGEPADISFQRSGMGMYSFVVFDQPIPDSLKAMYNDSCTYILANERLVLEYGGGAIGPQCFFNRNQAH